MDLYLFLPLLALPYVTALCGYESCPEVKPDMINVHLIPHSHWDVGWLKNVDEYYYGSNRGLGQEGIQYIIDTVIDELAKDPGRRFTIVEIAFFWRWWSEQNEDMQNVVKQLVNEGRLEFATGGWTASDEACPHYSSTIDQMAWGLKFLNDTFGECGRPHVAWMIDSFGHSNEIASEFAQMGFDGMFFARIHYQDKEARIQSKNMNVIWEGSSNLGEASRIFTETMFNHYSPPPGFCFDAYCRDEPVIDNPRVRAYNVPQRVDAFIENANWYSGPYRHNQVLMPMGDDFLWQSSHHWYKNTDKIIRYVNARQETGGNVNVFYSTPSCYLKAVNEDNPILEVQTTDFLPYEIASHEHFTGYFTTKPSLKLITYKASGFLQICKQLSALSQLNSAQEDAVSILRDAVGIVQHHDAITGTNPDEVNNDYILRMMDGFQACAGVINNAYQQLLPTSDTLLPEQNFCHYINVSQCEPTETGSPQVVTLYNPLSRLVSPVIRLPVTGNSYQVTGPNGISVPSEVVPLSEGVLNLPGRQSPATSELIFQAPDLPPVGIRSYQIQQQDTNVRRNIKSKIAKTHENKGLLTIGFENVQAVFDDVSGLLQSVTVRGNTLPVTQNFFSWPAFQGDKPVSNHYVFRPATEEANVVSASATISVFEGELVKEVHQKFSDWISQTIRIYSNKDYVEFDWIVGPIPIDDNQGKEIVTRYSTDIANDGVFYTDANGREMQKRVRNFQPTFDLTVDEPIAGNFYPVTSRIILKDSSDARQVAILNDRSQGGSSLNDGELEIMLHRRVFTDTFVDYLNETEFGKGLVVRGRHWMVFGKDEDNPSFALQHRLLAQEFINPALPSFASSSVTFEEWATMYNTELSLLNSGPLPDNVHLLTLEQWGDRRLLLRIEHILETSDDPTLSQPATVDLQSILPFPIVEVQETTLDGNKWKAEVKRFSWRIPEGKTNVQLKTKSRDPIITLEPMQIKTFVITI